MLSLLECREMLFIRLSSNIPVQATSHAAINMLSAIEVAPNKTISGAVPDLWDIWTPRLPASAAPFLTYFCVDLTLLFLNWLVAVLSSPPISITCYKFHHAALVLHHCCCFQLCSSSAESHRPSRLCSKSRHKTRQWMIAEQGQRTCVGGNFGGCSLLDVKCICSNADYISNLSCCIAGGCSADDQAS